MAHLESKDANNGSAPALDNEIYDSKSNYFYYYAKIREQQNMLQDIVRMNSYYAAIANNREDFKDKVVLDVGTGTGVLAMFAAKAGARKVYAVEASESAKNARKLIAANGHDGVIEVLQDRIENITLPEKVDIIISEPMGVALVHERMIESFVYARKFLKEGGKMCPSTGTIYAAPFTDEQLYNQQASKSLFFQQARYYDIDWTCLSAQATRDHTSQPIVGLFQPGRVLCDIDKTPKHDIDFLTVTTEELQNFTISLDCTINRTALMHGYVVWFSTHLSDKVVLDTSPYLTATHWQQCRLLTRGPLAVNQDQQVAGSLGFAANEKRSYNVTLNVSLPHTRIKRTTTHQLHDQLYYSDPTMLSTPAPPMYVTPLNIVHPSFGSNTPVYAPDVASQLRYAHLLSREDRLQLQKQLQIQYTAALNQMSMAPYSQSWIPSANIITAATHAPNRSSSSHSSGGSNPQYGMDYTMSQ